jgi:hypothetical protein
LLAILAFVVAFAVLAPRYLRLRRYWVKHTYYAFLALKAIKGEKQGQFHDDD